MRRKQQSSNAEISDDQHMKAKRWTALMAGCRQDGGGVDAKREEDVLFSFFSA